MSAPSLEPEWIRLPAIVNAAGFFSVGPGPSVTFDLTQAEVITPEALDGLALASLTAPVSLRMLCGDVLRCLQARFARRLRYHGDGDWTLYP